MRVPVTIPLNTIKIYTQQRKQKNEKTLNSEDLNWDSKIPRNLRDLCVEAIAGNWTENPILEEIETIADRYHLLTILPTDLPLSLTVPKIPDDVYWRRCFKAHWPQTPKNTPITYHSHNIVQDPGHATAQPCPPKPSPWKKSFLELWLQEYIERLKPEDYDGEKIKELSDLCGAFVQCLCIRELQCAENSPNRVPLNAILTGFGNLNELSLCFKQVYVGEKFTWDVLRVSLNDVKLLAKGLEKCQLGAFRLQNSEIDDKKLTLLLNSLQKHKNLKALDFSHCLISCSGALALSKCLLDSQISDLNLTNNQIGPVGTEALCYAMSKSSCNLRSLNLKLNPILGTGMQHLTRVLALGPRKIQKLGLGSCSIRECGAIGGMIEHNTTLESLDLSNNSLGEEMGPIILQGLRYNKTLKFLDIRMCKLSPKDELQILEKIALNRRSPNLGKRPIIVEPQDHFEISKELEEQIHNVFLQPGSD